MNVLLWILLSTFLVSLISLTGIVLLNFKKDTLNQILILLVGLSAGSFIGGAFLHLLPEAIEKINNFLVYLYIILGFCLFFLIRFLLAAWA